MTYLRPALTVVLGATALVALQLLVARMLPSVGAGFFLVTIVVLSMLEGCGPVALQDSPDGWLVPNELGAYFALVIWWAFWCVVLAFFYRRCSSSWLSRGQRAASFASFLRYLFIAAIASASALPVSVFLKVLSLFFLR